jgi:hypothetical protein
MAEFPIVIPFKLGKVRNSNDWTKKTENKFQDLIDLINEKIDNGYKDEILYSVDSKITLTTEYNIKEVYSYLGMGPTKVNIEVDIPTSMDKPMYYLILDSNRARVNLISDNLNNSIDNESYNRTLYIFRKLDESNIIVYKCLKDIYVKGRSDFESEDFLDWDLLTG